MFKNLESLQGKLLKSALGIHKFGKNTQLLQALGILKIETSVNIGYLELLRSVLASRSRATSFYIYLLKQLELGKLCNFKNLVGRSYEVCGKYNISLHKYIFDNHYACVSKESIKQSYTGEDGVVDSIRQLLIYNDPYSREVLNMLLMPF